MAAISHMRRDFGLPPMRILAATAIVGLAAVTLVILLASHQPWLGLDLAPTGDGIRVQHATGPSADIPPGTRIASIANDTESADLRARDIVAEPDGAFTDYANYLAFFARQSRLAAIQNSPSVTFTSDTGQRWRVEPDRRGRPIMTLPLEFWVQVLVGALAWLISAAVFAFRPREASARYLLLSGAATLTFSALAGIYSTRELAMPGGEFRLLSDLNFLGGSVFTASFVALLLNYPRRIGPAWLGLAIVATYLAWFGLQEIGFFESMMFARRFLVMVGVSSTFGLAAMHWFRTRSDPVARAALQWFLLSWIVGTAIFSLLILLPQMFGIDTSDLQGYGFLLFLLVYGGLAVGILRYHLFDLGEWWGQAILWILTILMLVAFDMLFLLGLQFSHSLSLGLALLISGLVWLPLRTVVWTRFLARPTVSQGSLFNQIVDIALTLPGQDRSQRWRDLLQAVFDPLDLKPGANTRASVIEDDGLTLTVPAIGTMPAYRLEYARKGRSLFTPRDAARTDEMVAMLRHASASRSAYEKGVAEERKRIARDMHDNIGAQLLGALHSRETERKDTMIRETLSDLREIINDAFAAGHTFDAMLAELRLETAERLSSANIALDWIVDAEADPILTPQMAYALRSVVREAVSNVIKHASARRMAIHLAHSHGELSLAISDDGVGFDPQAVPSGRGLANMQERVAAMAGRFELLGSGPGTRLAAHIPLKIAGASS